MTHRTLVATLAIAGLLSACNREQPSDPAAIQSAPTSAPASAAPASNPVVTTADTATPVANGAGTIMAQPGPDASTWELKKVHVTGNLLTAQFYVRPAVKDDITYHGDIADISMVDDATSQRYGVVKDQSGNALVSDLSGSNLRVSTSTDEAANVWVKFAAPPATSRTVSITLPEVAPFDGVAVTR